MFSIMGTFCLLDVQNGMCNASYSRCCVCVVCLHCCPKLCLLIQLGFGLFAFGWFSHCYICYECANDMCTFTVANGCLVAGVKK
jgi:hypothetical protein